MISPPKVITIDFETESIEPRPVYPPLPVGVSIRKENERKSKYYSWGHPTGNNCTQEEATRILQEIFGGSSNLLFHNAKFDVDVATTHMQCSNPIWSRIHDTLFLLFLNDPHSDTLALKPSAEFLLGLPPEEQEKVRDWLYDNKIVKRNLKGWGASICMAPGNLVGEYACGDTDRTLALFNLLYPKIHDMDMLQAYDTERQLMPILLENERKGIRVRTDKLRGDYNLYLKSFEKVDNWIRKKLNSPELNIDSDKELSDVLDKLGIVTEWAMTPTGKRSTSKDNLSIGKFNDKQVALALGYRNRLATCMSTFMLPWLNMAEKCSGRIHTNWNQVRGGGSSGMGTRTGRMSSNNPNFTNIPTDFYKKDDGYEHPCIQGILELPMMREYILPEEGHIWLHRDYSQQEPRILAHFEDGLLKDKYNNDPTMDIHNFVRDTIVDLFGVELHRKAVKIINLGIIYGKGSSLLAKELNVSVKEAKNFKDIHAKALPGIKNLESEIKSLAKNGGFIRTWGGRCYHCEKPVFDNSTGRVMTFEYKLLNYLIQGSAADCTKRSIINYHETRKEGQWQLAVHDENNVSCPVGCYKEEMKILKNSMENVDFDVPILSDGMYGRNWGSLIKYED